MWQGITNYMPTSLVCDSDTSLQDALNIFKVRFEPQNGVSEEDHPSLPKTKYYISPQPI